jgi:hypothetical protein
MVSLIVPTIDDLDLPSSSETRLLTTDIGRIVMAAAGKQTTGLVPPLAGRSKWNRKVRWRQIWKMRFLSSLLGRESFRRGGESVLYNGKASQHSFPFVSKFADDPFLDLYYFYNDRHALEMRMSHAF